MAAVKHLVLDVGVAVDAWMTDGAESNAAHLVRLVQASGNRLWVAASTLATIQSLAHERCLADGMQPAQAAARVARFMHDMLHAAQVLTAFGFEQDAICRTAFCLADAQIAAAVRALTGVPHCIVTDKPDFDNLGEVRCLDPSAARAWLVGAAELGHALQPVRFADLPSQQAMLRPQIEAGIENVLRHGHYILGPEVAAFERALAGYVGAAHCIGVGNGTDALQIALMALGIGPGDEVIVPAFNYIAAVEAVLLLGAQPVFVDIDARTYNLAPTLLDTAITARTRAVVVSSLYGQCADFDAINPIAARHGVPVIEDAAQSMGAQMHGRRSGNLSTIACTSFFPSKPLGGYGDGGALMTNDAALAKVMRQIATHGQEGRYRHVRLGLNSRLDTLQAAVLLPKLRALDDELESREQVAARYGRLIAPMAVVGLPWVPPDHRSAWGQYTIRVPDRDRVRSVMAELGVPSIVHYPEPLHRQPVVNQPALALAQSEAAAREVLSLPMGPYLSEVDQDRVLAALARALA